MTLPLFDDDDAHPRTKVALGAEAVLLSGFARDRAKALVEEILAIEQAAPFRHMQTPGGFTMSVALTNCGRFGWTSDERGYRYTERDPLTKRPWPKLPDAFRDLGRGAASEAGFPDFDPDACLMNRYLPGSRLSLHQDINERTFDAPIVSVSLGISAVFLFGGQRRTERPARIQLKHGDVVVWGGVDRLRFHGISPLKPARHELTGECRFNLTLRHAG